MSHNSQQQQQQQPPPRRFPPTQSSIGNSFVHAVSLDWHHTAEGRGVLAHLQEQQTGERKQYGFLERPLLPPTILVAPFKLFLSGRAGAGKTTLVSFLAGRADWISAGQQGETPGIRVSTVYWPTKIRQQLVLFQLDIWDHGENAGRKYGHIQPVCQDKADGCLFVFSFSDKSAFEDLDAQLTQLSHSPEDAFCPLVVGTRYGAAAEAEVGQRELTAFENKWFRPVLKVRNVDRALENESGTNPNEVAFVLNLICDQLWCHRNSSRGAGEDITV